MVTKRRRFFNPRLLILFIFDYFAAAKRFATSAQLITLKKLQYNQDDGFDNLNSKHVPKHPFPKIGCPPQTTPGINGLSWLE